MLSIKKIAAKDIDTLISIASTTFRDAFYHLADPADFEEYASGAFTKAKLLSEINNPDSDFYFVLEDDESAGYLKLNYAGAQTELQDNEAMEIERIYILSKHQGKQIGQKLIDFAIETAHTKGLKYIWLGVWEKNPNAIRFYQKNGFEIFGRHTFNFGTARDEDWLMKKVL